jgi:hypothetical protein
MRSFILAAAAALFAVAAPGLANAQTGGAIGVSVASLDEDDDKDNAWAISGIVLSEVAPSWTLQLRAVSVDMDHSSHSDAFSDVEVGVNYQISEMIAVGGFVGQFGDGEGDSFLTYGVAAGVDFGRIQAAASVSGGDDMSGDGDFTNATVEVGGTLMDNLYVGVYGSWTDSDEADVDSLGIHADYMFPGTRFGIGAFYQTSDVSFDGGGDTDTDAFGLRLSFMFGDEVMDRALPGSEHVVYDAVAAQ